uniref:At1g61320/AtMIF1 LRR domain-containing protein n=1 Tax=Triticum urartu TaxID=4572 RepID=A0A8R7UJF8_TRIUA
MLLVRLVCRTHFCNHGDAVATLTLSKETLGLNGKGIAKDEMARDLVIKVDGILKNHSGVGMKKLELNLHCCSKVDRCYLNSWLRIAFRVGIEELTMLLCPVTCQ